MFPRGLEFGNPRFPHSFWWHTNLSFYWISDHEQIIAQTYLAGKKWFRNDIALAEERLPLIEAYLNQLTKIKTIGESYQAQAFFGARPGDPKEDDPSMQTLIKNSQNYQHEKTGKCCCFLLILLPCTVLWTSCFTMFVWFYREITLI